MKLGDIIYNYRMEHNYSIREFARICELSHAQIYFMERGLNSQGEPFTPKVKSLKKLAAGMGISFNELLSVCDKDTIIGWDRDDIEIKVPPEKQEIIDKIILSTPEQFEKIKSIINLVMP